MATPHEYAAKLLDQLRELDQATTAAYFDMGQILSAIQHSKLYEILNYESLKHLIEEELSYTSSTAYRYLHTYRHFRRLKYTKGESLALLDKFGYSHMSDVLPGMTVKVGERAISTRINALDEHQINFTLTDNELQECEQALEKMGGMRSDTGRWANSSQAFMEMVREINSLIPDTPKLRVVK